MPRYKDSPEVRVAKKERKEKLREFLSLLEVEDMSDLRSVFKEMVGEVLENGLEAELDDELGYSRYDYRNKDTENSRNSQRKKAEKEKQLVDHSVDCCYFADSCWSRIFGTAKISKRSCTGKTGNDQGGSCREKLCCRK